LILIAVVLFALAAFAPVRAQTQNRAGVVVQFSDGSVTTRCVTFNEDSITGYDLLRRSRLPIAVEFGSMGAGVCKIGNEGCAYPSQPCFCQCQTLGAGCTYWVYSQLREGAWTVSGLGAGARQVRDGDVDGWAWGKGDGNSGIVPVGVTLDQICSAGAVAAAQPTIVATVAPPNTAVPPTEVLPTEVSPAPAPSATTLPASPSASPTPSATMAATTPTATMEPIATATAVAAMATTLSTPTPTSATNNSRDPHSDPRNQERDRGQQPTTNIFGYIIFGVIAVGLIGALAVLRRGGGKP
jgi:hypothetical protein